MCGITGYVDWNADLRQKNALLETMGSTLACRGPDAEGVWSTKHAAFAHRRLIVIDPEGGAQPMSRQVRQNTYTIVYNGELYNMGEIRQQLESAGLTPQTRSDTELLLLAYAQWGAECVEKLNGIFAFAIWDKANQSLFVARDRLGVKPLFYAERDGMLVFGSEIKAILAHPSIPAEVDAEGLAELFFVGPARTPGHAVFRGLCDLRPGHYLMHSRLGTTISQYWKLENRPHVDDLVTTANTVRELLQDAVTRQLVSDVPVVTLLSGGLDSSAVTAFAAQGMKEQNRGTLSTYSVDFIGNDEHFEANAFQTSRDAPWVKRVSTFLGTDHHDVIFDTPELIEHQTRPMLARDLPGQADIDISLYLFCKEIKKSATVALSGEAADEIFGGYPWFHREDALSAHTFPWSLQLKERLNIFSKELASALVPEEYVAYRYKEALKEVPENPDDDDYHKRIREISYLNITRFLPTLLERKDRMSMAAGLEVRVPFCDHNLVEYVWNIPWEQKSFGSTPKAILRKAVEGVLPDDVIYRKKSPYPSTHNPLYLEAVRERMKAILSDSQSPILPLLDVKQVEEVIESSYVKSVHRPWFGQIMGVAQMFDYLIQINEWLKEYKVKVVF